MTPNRLTFWYHLGAICLAIPLSASAHPGTGIVVDAKGQVYFVHGTRNRILKVDSAGKLTTLVEGTVGKTLSNPHHLVFDKVGNICSVGDSDGKICRVLPGGKLEQIYPFPDGTGLGSIGSGGDPFALDAAGTIYCIEYRQFQQCQIRAIGPDGRINKLAGGAWGYADGKGTLARFRDLHSAGFVCTSDGALLVTDNGTSLRKIVADGTVMTLAGGEDEGYADGSGKQARFRGAMGLSIDPQGNIYVADSHNRRIRKITPEGTVSTVAGSGKRGGTDGPALEASFDNPTGVATAPDGSVYVLDFLGDDPRLRKLSTDRHVTTVVVVK
jgi:sugar lactone lactonase YvrE